MGTIKTKKPNMITFDSEINNSYGYFQYIKGKKKKVVLMIIDKKGNTSFEKEFTNQEVKELRKWLMKEVD